MDVTPIFFKKVILESDSEVWSNLRKYYLPSEYHNVYSIINKYFEEYGSLPTFDALKLYIRSNALLQKIYAIFQVEDVDVPASELLEYVKNEYVQEEVLQRISSYLDESVTVSTAKENIELLRRIVSEVEERVDISDPEEDLAKMELFLSEEELEKCLCLGLNSEFDSKVQFLPTDYILIGGVRGTGKSLTCSNIAVHAYEKLNKSSIYFTIEMPSRSILMRNCAIATGVSLSKLKHKDLSIEEWERVAKWWSGRFVDGQTAFNNYKEHRSFEILHSDLKKSVLIPDKQLDIVYNPNMSLGHIRAELDKKVEQLKPAVIIVDYVNQVSRYDHKSMGQYDWTEQIEVSKALKTIAQDYQIPVVTPYQIDASGEARFSKGLLDSADAAFIIEKLEKSKNAMGFKCVKMRDNDDEFTFCSKMDWKCVKIGPESVEIVEEEEEPVENTNVDEGVYEL